MDIGDTVRVHYEDARGKACKGLARIIVIQDHVEDAEIAWLYTRRDLRQAGVSAAELAELDFGDGDLALSNHDQSIPVSCLSPRTSDDPVEFFWDGESVRRIRSLEDHGLARQSVDDQVREWLLSDNLWRDTKYGTDLWFLLSQLSTFGQAGNKASAEIRAYFFDEDNGNEPLPSEITFEALEEIEHATCEACRMPRALSLCWTQTNRKLGSNCAARIEALSSICNALHDIRQNAISSSPYLPDDWVATTYKRVEDLRRLAMTALSDE